MQQPILKFPYASHADEDGIITIDSVELHKPLHFAILTSLESDEGDFFEHRVLRKVSNFVNKQYNHVSDQDKSTDNNDDSDFENPLRMVFIKLVKEELPEVFNIDLQGKVDSESLPIVLVYAPTVSASSGDNNEPAFFNYLTNTFYKYAVTKEFQQSIGSINKEHYKFADFLSQLANMLLKVDEEFDTEKFAKQFACALIVFVIFKKKIYPLLKDHFLHKIVLALSLVALLLCCTGYSFVKMNQIVLLAHDDKGQIMWFSGGFRWQFGIEMFTVSGMYLLLATLTYVLVFLSKTVDSDSARCISALVLVAMLVMASQYLVSCFRIKYPEYMT
ncbi:hypothetical protein ACO0QE_000719 [Hanseniaspora vineae]